jgi:hypothetical protein
MGGGPRSQGLVEFSIPARLSRLLAAVKGSFRANESIRNRETTP